MGHQEEPRGRKAKLRAEVRRRGRAERPETRPWLPDRGPSGWGMVSGPLICLDARQALTSKGCPASGRASSPFSAKDTSVFQEDHFEPVTHNRVMVDDVVTMDVTSLMIF